MANTPEHREAAARLKEVAPYVKQFRTVLAAAVQGLQAAETFKTSGGGDAAFVEATPDAVVFHVGGTNRTYQLSDLPPGLALAIADRKLSARDPASSIVKGAYLAVHPRADNQTRKSRVPVATSGRGRRRCRASDAVFDRRLFRFSD